MPPAGSTVCPSANILNRNSNMRLEAPSDRSKKMPPKNGRKKRSIMLSENAQRVRRASRAVVSSRSMSSGTVRRRS
jgi:hypothetical protein